MRTPAGYFFGGLVMKYTKPPFSFEKAMGFPQNWRAFPLWSEMP